MRLELVVGRCRGERRVCLSEEAQGPIQDGHEKGASLRLGEKRGKLLLEWCEPTPMDAGIVVVQLSCETIASRERIEVSISCPQEPLHARMNVVEHILTISVAKHVHLVHNDEQLAHLPS